MAALQILMFVGLVQLCASSIAWANPLPGQSNTRTPEADSSQPTINLSAFMDSAHHWRDIRDDDYVIRAHPHQAKHPASAVAEIADNILLLQKDNGGWPKNYDVQAILTDEQKAALKQASHLTETTTFDNGATHSHVDYLAAAYAQTHDERYKRACLHGIEFILSAQYGNGGWPQFYPNPKGYARYITFNDGAMIGVMNVLQKIVRRDARYAFVDQSLRERVKRAFDKGIDCILKCQIVDHDTLTVWCQQHDDVTLLPQSARTFEPACMSNLESTDITEFLMQLDNPDQRTIRAVEAAAAWFARAVIHGVRVATVPAPTAAFQYQTVNFDRVVIRDSDALPIWTRFTELGTHRALFSNRNWKPVYSLAEVDRERRTGYGWYTYAPARIVTELYPAWKKKWNE